MAQENVQHNDMQENKIGYHGSSYELVRQEHPSKFPHCAIRLTQQLESLDNFLQV